MRYLTLFYIYMNIKIKFKISFLSHTSYISSAQDSHVASCLRSQQCMPDSSLEGVGHCLHKHYD